MEGQGGGYPRKRDILDTRSVFDRYNITSERDLREATQKLTAYIQEQKTPVTGKVSGKVLPFEQKEANIIG